MPDRPYKLERGGGAKGPRDMSWIRRVTGLPPKGCSLLCLAAAGLSLSACADVMPRLAQGLGLAEEPQQAEIERDQRQYLQKSQHEMGKLLSKQLEENKELANKVAGLQLRLLEKEARLRDSGRRFAAAVLEVVRAKAKLRSWGSKAEAASNLAEAEVALTDLKDQSAGGDQYAASSKAEELLRLATQEFEHENYGGALYLTSQAKSLLQNSQEGSVNRETLPLLPGEVAFDLPVSLRARGRSNLRAGPGPEFKVLTAVGDGASLVGHSYKGRWIRVRAVDEWVGWIFYKLVEVP